MAVQPEFTIWAVLELDETMLRKLYDVASLLVQKD